MKQAARRGWALMLALVMVTGVCFLFAGRKQGMFIDEIYTYGLSNSSYRPFLSGLQYGEIENRVFTREELLDYVSVTGDEGFDFGSVYYNQVHDVHPPLYYWLFNIASTFAKGSFSLWTGLILDYLFYLGCVLMLYALVRRLGGSQLNGAAAAVLYGLSLIGLSTMLMIRMYVLLTLLTLVLAYFIADLMRSFRKRTCVFVALTLLAGLMTQYYFVFYAFFLCAAYVLWALAKKEYRALAWFVPCALIGALSLLLLFPAALDHLFSGKLVSGESAVDNLKNLSQYPARFKVFFGAVRHGLKAAILAALAAAAGLALSCKKQRAAVKEGRVRFDWLVIIVPAFVTLVLVAVISPVDEERYIYNIMPIFVLAVSFLLYLLEESWGDFARSGQVKALVFLAVAALALWTARSAPPAYLYPEHAEYNAALAAHRDDPCVVLAEPEYAFIPMTEDLMQLLVFPEVYVTDENSLTPMLDYIGDADEAVLFIDVSKFWSSGYDAEEIIRRLADETDFDRAEELFSLGLSTTYLISK
ncbi:MAG: glycosyltransferase family 39 protein [Oscillospiraceae bacterium]|nr:glycosyltransferase family 39 protein [Oscillospiraceae bacterium]